MKTLANVVRPMSSATAVPDVTVTLPALIKGAPLVELRSLITERFDAEGYEVVIALRESASEPKPEPESELEALLQSRSPPEALKPKKKAGRPSSVDPETAAKKLKGNGADARSPEIDKEFVLDTLGAIVRDPARKQSVLIFAGARAKANGCDKLGDVPADKFPAIRLEMEREFDRA